MKVYIVLKYINFEGMYEICRVDCVYITKKLALKRKKCLDKFNMGSDITFRIIQKNIKGLKK